jgi:hypothetical protein
MYMVSYHGLSHFEEGDLSDARFSTISLSSFSLLALLSFLFVDLHDLYTCIVMTFLVRECYGSPKKQEF